MKLIPLILLTSLSVGVRAQKFRQEQFPLPPQFQNGFPGFFSSDSSLYLPPESNTPLPYFPIKNMNLPFPYLPPTGTKAPSTYPTPYPFLISSSVVPNFEEDDDDDDEGRIRLSTPHPSQQNQNRTQSQYGPQQYNGPDKERREMRDLRATPRMNFANFPNPIDRIDVKFPMKYGPPPPAPLSTTQASTNQTPAAPRRMIIDNRNDVGLDQVKSASFQGPNFLHAGPGPIFVSSTTEPAIPILRLSNEMDLDGSFSYEALGADQTHYMQHSRMENMGTDKEEQVVEGSYSYVGDNGQTYTVHYIADSNGFRASGEHLPVAPPIPEIIQRAVQYNLAEEAKKPPHLRNSWQGDGGDNEISNNNERQPQFMPPPRNLFTGRTPEAFSYSYSQGTNTQNNLVASASEQVPVKAVEYTTEQPKAKPNNGPISPQITFLASQGAHVPSLNPVQNSISRMFTTEKSSMPQLVNYEASIKDQDREESNKALWRWQYGINANNNNIGQSPNKDSISRSLGDHDEVMINFSDMTPEQYTRMMRTQLSSNPQNANVAQHTPSNQAHYVNQNSYPTNHQQNFQKNHQNSNFDLINYPNQPNPILKDYQNTPAPEMNYKSPPDAVFKSYQNNPNLNSYQNANKEALPQKSTDMTNNLQHNNDPNFNFNNYQQVSNEGRQPFSSTEAITTHAPAEELHKHDYESSSNYQSQNTPKPIEESREFSVQTKPKLVTHKDFVFPTQSHTVTQDYNFEDDFYEPRKIKSLAVDTTAKVHHKNQNDFLENNYKHTMNNPSDFHVKSPQQNENVNNTPQMQAFEKAVTPNVWLSTNSVDYETTVTSTAEPPMSTLRSMTGFKFTDFIVRDEENKHDFASNGFKPIITESTKQIETTATTTETSVEEIIQNNIFLKSFLNPQNTQEKEIIKASEPNRVLPLSNKLHAEPKTEKPIIFIQSQPKPANELKAPKKKHVDISDILNYVSMKNHFELNKTKPKGKQTSNNGDLRSEIRFIPVQQEKPKENSFEENNFSQVNTNTYKNLNREQQDELKGIIRNYKVLQRNNNNANKHDSNHLRTDLSPPPLKPLSLPPLGRAGPSMKSYLPPIYV